ncbi:MAG: hypothetical protein K0R60_135 [Microbacterium sp.]|jgi:hypothetical protein|nr:hypothetical protein [Microbacterium sp.]
MSSALPPAPDELASRLGTPLDGADAVRAVDALADATTLALAEVPERTADLWSVSAPAIVRLVVLQAARREYDNPRGVTAETYGEHSVTLGTTSGVYLTPREVALIQRAHSPRRPRSVRTPSPY